MSGASWPACPPYGECWPCVWSFRRRESSVEEVLIEMCLAGVSVRRVEDILEALWGGKKYMNMSA